MRLPMLCWYITSVAAQPLHAAGKGGRTAVGAAVGAAAAVDAVAVDGAGVAVGAVVAADALSRLHSAHTMSWLLQCLRNSGHSR